MDLDTPASITTPTGVWHPFVSRSSAALIAANVLGMFVYLRLASLAWAIPAERAAGIDSVTGEPFVWAMAVVPVWGIVLLANIIWAIIAHQRGQRVSAMSRLVILMGWVAAVIIDFAHH
jgi:hypothetical protein